MTLPRRGPYPRRMQQPWRLGPRGQRWLDTGIAGLLVALTLLSAAAGVSPVVVVLCLAQCAPLWWRRRHPVAVFAVVAGASALQAVLLDAPVLGQVAFPVATYSVARYATAAWGLVAIATGLVGAAVASYDWLRPYGVDGVGAHLSYFATIAAIVATAWALGSLNRVREAYVASLVERGLRLEREAAQQALLAAQEERARIAREMHDVVAHGLSVIVVQADGARYAATKEPQRATEALATIAETGREALTEMRQLLGLLRSEDGPALAPQPGLADVDALVEEARTTGMPVELRRDPQLPRVPDSVGLTAYRIVQESLTNVRKHAGPAASAEVVLGWDGGSLQVEVADDGRGAATRPDGRGLGLAGIRERVAVHGGTVDAGPRPGGGFAVSARIPV